jgi:hypothetical protein
MSTIKLVQGDTRPALVCTITDDNTGLPVSLTGATCRLKFRPQDSTTIRSTLTGTVTDPTNGVVVFYWATDPTVLDGPQGNYQGEIEITFADGQIQTVFDVLRFYLREDF